MDQRWRVVNDHGQSTLFTSALTHNLPTSSHDIGWNRLVQLLHRIYGYDSLVEYESLINKPWLSDTLQSLKDGTLPLEKFALLDIRQREIITQAMFSTIPKDDIP
jgi:hypothetical protein